ncbi:glycosyltransferase [Parasediminibacterium paludis]|uniref:Glycosyltransferase n=1 Tax=Parasediminibacterium paludis TaxID=908966 RepID=A0ABV8PZT0_9BACT
MCKYLYTNAGRFVNLKGIEIRIPMKILTVVASMNPKGGGVVQAVKSFSNIYANNNILETIVTTDFPKEDFVKANSNIIALGRQDNSWGYSRELKRWLLDNIEQYDVVILHGLWLYTNYAVRQVFKKIKKNNIIAVPKLYIMPHGMLDPYFQKAKERRLKAIRNALYWYLIEKNIINSCDKILFTCNEELRLAAQTFFGYKPKTCININLGIEVPPTFEQKQKEAFQKICPKIVGKKYLLYFGRIDSKKGVDILIEAYGSIVEYLVKNDLHVPELVIAGPGKETLYGKQLVMQVRNNEWMSDSVHFTGMLVGDSKWGAIYGCDAFILPSHQENFGIAIVEALACSKAVLISNKINIYTEIALSNAGIVNNDTLDGTVQSLLTWISLTDKVKQIMSENAYHAYNQYFNLKNTEHTIIEMLDNA